MLGGLAPEYKTMMITPSVQDQLFIWRLDRSRNVAVLNMPKSKIGKVEVPIRGFLGTIGVLIAPEQLLASALASYPDEAVALTYSDGSTHLTFSGRTGSGAATGASSAPMYVPCPIDSVVPFGRRTSILTSPFAGVHTGVLA